MKSFKEKVKELKVVKLHETFYLGIVKDDTIVDAIDCADEFDLYDIDRWFRFYNIDDVYEEIKLVGSTGYTIRPFNIDESRHVEQCLLMMEDSKKLALKQIENDYFRQAMRTPEKKKDEDEEDE